MDVKLAAEYADFDFRDEYPNIRQIQLDNYDIDIMQIIQESAIGAAEIAALEQERSFDEARKEAALEGRYAD